MIEQNIKTKQILKTMTVCENCKNCTYKYDFPYCLLENKYKGLYQSCNKFKRNNIYQK